MARVEEILEAASAGSGATPQVNARPTAEHALWICACVTMEDAPTWLIYDTDTGVTWRRVPERVEPMDLVDARLSAGGHADPSEVLLWLQGQVPDPWARGGAGWGDATVLEELRHKIRV